MLLKKIVKCYDLGFCFKVDEEKDLVFFPILRQELVVLVKSGHELSKKRRLRLFDLQKYPLITYRENNPLGIYIRRLFNEEKIVPNIVFAFDEGITISEMVAQDLGVALLNNMSILQNYLSIIPLDIKSDPPIVYLAYHKNLHHSKAVKKFIRHLKTNSKSHNSTK